MRLHELKIWPDSLEAIYASEKRAEVRRDDRDFHAGDVLHLREWEPAADYAESKAGEYTGNGALAIITHIEPLQRWGLDPAFVLLSYALLAAQTDEGRWMLDMTDPLKALGAA